MSRVLPIFTILTVLLSISTARSATVDLVYDDDRQPGRIGAEVIDGIVFASVRDVASGLSLETQWFDDKQRLVVSAGPVQARFTAWNPIVVVDDIAYNLPRQPVLNGGTLLAPAGDIARLLDPFTAGNLDWNPEAKAFTHSSVQYNVRPGTIEERENGTLATIRVPGDLIVEEDTRLPNWLDLTIIGGRIDAQAFRHVLLDGAVQQIVAYQYENSAVLSFRVEPGYRYDTMRSSSSGWLMVLFRREMPLPSPLAQVGELVEINREQWSINTIVIDPGHGGRDPGAVAVDGVYEKDIVLSIANRLARRLETELEVSVVQTRSSDQFVSLRERGRLATQNGGKLFISIHANTNPDSRVSGVETYFLSEAQTEEARQVARLENSALRYENAADQVEGAPDYDWYAWQDVDEILAGMTSTRFLTESQELAKLIQDELVRTLGARDLGVRQAEFYVMKGTLATMPSILVEVGFLSNPAEARHLRQAAYQRRAADAIFRAVREFKQRYERDL